MYKKRTKFIASMLVLMLTMTHLSIVGEVIATSLDNQTIATNNENVEFDAYFMEDKQKTHSAKKEVGKENYLYTAITVKNTGYLKNVVVDLESSNYVIADKVEDSKISKIENNKIYFNQIRNGNNAEVQLPIQLLRKDEISVNEFNKESKVKLTATYVDGNGKEKQIEKDVEIKLAWTAEIESLFNMQISKFVPYEVNEQKGLVLQTVVKSNVKDNILPVKENLVEIINNISENEHINKIERMIKIILKKKLGKDETDRILERINDKKKGLYDMLTVLDRIEMNEKKIREQDRKKALKEGMEEGINKTKIEIAKELLKDKIDIDKISKWTKVSKSELEKMQNKKEKY